MTFIDRVVAARTVIGFCVPSLLFVIGDWITGFVPNKTDNLAFFTIVGATGLVLAVLAPWMTVVALAGAIIGTAWRRQTALMTIIMWLFVALSIWASAQMAAIIKRCCV